MRQHTIFIIWGGGLLLAVVLYLTGPDRFFAATLDALTLAQAAFHNLLLTLGLHAFNVVRAAAIAIYIVFLTLAGLAIKRGLRAWSALILVTMIFLVLVWRPEEVDPTPTGRWLGALVLAIFGAVSMTHRLTAPPGATPVRPSWPTYPGGTAR